MKKNLLAYILWWAIIVAWLVYMFTSRGGTVPVVLESKSMGALIPWTYDQLLVLQMDDALKNVAKKSNNLIDPETFWWIVETIEEIVMYQKVEEERGHNILFIKWNSSFTIEQIEALWTVAWDDSYEYADLWKWYWAYAPKESLDRYKKRSWSSISANKWRKKLHTWLKEKWNNVWFLSIPVLADTTNLLAWQFADRLEYTYFVSAISEKNPSWYLVLQLADETLSWPISWLTPSLSTLLWDDTIMYLEFADILSLFALERDQLEIMLPALLGQRWASQWIAFDNSDVATILDALEKNVALVAYPSETSPMQLSLHLLFEDTEIYWTVRKFGPLLKWLVSGLLWNTDSSLIKETVTEESIWYTLDLPGVEVWSGASELSLPASSFPILEIAKENSWTIVSLFSETPDIEGDDMLATDIAFTENSKAVFGRDAWLMQESFLQWALQQQSELLWTDSLFQTWSLAWYVDVLPKQQQVRLEFSVQ